MIEVLVSAVLLLMLLGMAFNFLIPTLRASVLGTTRVELQQSAMVALAKLSADLQGTCSGGVGLYTDTSQSTWPRTTYAVAINPIANVDPTGSQLWAQQLIVYSYDTTAGTIVRKLCAPSGVVFPISSPVSVFGSALQSVAAAKTRETLVATNVTKFYVWTANGSDSVITNPVYIDLGVQRQEASQAVPQTFEMTRTVSMRQKI